MDGDWLVLVDEGHPLCSANLWASHTCVRVLHTVDDLRASVADEASVGVAYLPCGGVDPASAQVATDRMLSIVQLEIPFTVVTSGAQGMCPMPALNSLWGLARVANTERPECTVRCIDVAENCLMPERVVTLLGQHTESRELVLGHDGELTVPRLSAATVQTASEPECMDNNATYWVTGGLGSLGLLTARWLLGQRGGHVSLLTRRDVSIDEVLCSGGQDVAWMAEYAGRITVVQCDVSSLEDVTRCVRAVPTSAPLRGVVHAAGVLQACELTC